ncbi:MAG: GDP-mannose 4,6-dehydratase [candidate division Zixibacteria bacterium]|nr:GDP-mannose 4,6-dehydratase [candidate division Zixibacteria bacterium]
MNRHFWRGRSVLITGFEGFLGSHLTKALIYGGAKVVGLDIKVRRKETILTVADYRRMTVIKGSVTNYRLLGDILTRKKINVVFHLAAEAIVGRCHDNPRRTFSVNIKGTWNILEACRNSKTVKSIVIASSDKAYGSHKKLPYMEDAPLIGNHPYDVSKSCADLIAYTYFHTYGLPVAVTRCGNIYGPGDFNFSRIIPDAMQCIKNNKTLLIRSDGRFVRDYVCVDDIVEGYILLAEKLEAQQLAGQAFNFSIENPITVLELLKQIDRVGVRYGKLEYKILNAAEYEIKKQYLSSAKARKILGWKPKHDLSQGLQKTISWYLDNI